MTGYYFPLIGKCMTTGCGPQLLQFPIQLNKFVAVNFVLQKGEKEFYFLDSGRRWPASSKKRLLFPIQE